MRLTNVLDSLKSYGLHVREKSSIKGLSNIEHTFDAVISKSGKIYGVFIRDKLNFKDYVSFIAIGYDTKTPIIIFTKEIDDKLINVIDPSKVYLRKLLSNIILLGYGEKKVIEDFVKLLLLSFNKENKG